MSANVLGIDPGAGGAIAVLDASGALLERFERYAALPADFIGALGGAEMARPVRLASENPPQRNLS